MNGWVTRTGRSDLVAQRGHVLADCCRTEHEAVYSHEGQFSEGPIYVVVCPRDGVSDYFTAEAVR